MNVRSVSEKEAMLFDRWLRGDEEALRELIARYESGVYALLIYMSGCSRDDAYRSTADCFTQAVRSRSKKDDAEKFYLQLLAIAVERGKSLTAAPAFEAPAFKDQALQNKESLKLVKQAILQLALKNRLLLLLRDLLNLTYTDVAKLCGIPVAGVRGEMAMARALLRDKLQEILRLRNI